MRKPGLIKVKSIETEEIIMAMAKINNNNNNKGNNPNNKDNNNENQNW